ncbi:sugar phosphate nucleotidyltransferase [Mangrovibacillus cuniculi]|uniref:Glucose-1-phosphate adenylyltransferase n=1 Tax=Mangrovibacillus cuniculi TaxID=2593652 RepID=A0A7S8CC96_9BACI|nr:sugar phosphate nucleotidyltransferase [Mangrovibacillus cuniculi]QPC47325.1 glucose-1-phosphate adenylyltransferase [Mangrovibacillus cuniculi]
MKGELLGVIDATTGENSLEELLTHRSLAALPFGGRYRLIDFILSSMTNSGIGSVAIFPKYQYRSLMDHLGSGKNWDLDRKRDGLFFFPSPSLELDDNKIGAFDHFALHLDYFKRSKQPYAFISNCFTVCNLSIQPILRQHQKSACDVTEIRKDGRSLDMYIVKTSLLIDLVENRQETGYTCMRDVVLDLRHDYHICPYETTNYAKRIDSIQTYYEANKELLTSTLYPQLFSDKQPIFTKVKDEPPTQYGVNAVVKNSLIANGCVIEGTVENSIIFRAVKIGKGVVVKDSIIMQKSQLLEGARVENAILDKDVKIGTNENLLGLPDDLIIIPKGATQGVVPAR